MEAASLDPVADGRRNGLNWRRFSPIPAIAERWPCPAAVSA